MKTKRQLAIQSAVIALSHCFCLSFAYAQNLSTLQPSQTSLPPNVAKLLQEAKLPESALGVYVIPATTTLEPPSLAINAELAKQPASIIKTLTAAIALDLLGPQFKGSTELLSPVKIGSTNSGNAIGDLVLRGSLNPEFDLRALEALLKQLRNNGVGLINGDVYIDRRAQTPVRLDIGLPPFDESPEFQYNFVPDALSLNMNLLPIVISSTKDQVNVSSDPVFHGLEFVQNLKLNNAPCKNWENTWKVPTATYLQVTLTGEFPRNCRVELSINVVDRTLFAELAFRNAWKSLGGLWTGRIRELQASELQASEIQTLEPQTREPQTQELEAQKRKAIVPFVLDDQSPNALHSIAIHQSRPLSEFIRNINKSSDNPIARLLFMALGEAQRKKEAAPPNQATTAALSKLAITQWLAVNGIDATGLVLDNGSGLSRTEKIAPITLAKVLQRAYSSLWQPEFLASLPIVGLDGSMRNRLKESPATWRARIKTGGLRNVTSIAGFVFDSKGQPQIIVAILNDDRASGAAGRKVLDALIEWVATQ